MAKVKRAGKRMRLALEKQTGGKHVPTTQELMEDVKPELVRHHIHTVGSDDDICITQTDLEDYERRLQFTTRRRRVFY